MNKKLNVGLLSYDNIQFECMNMLIHEESNLAEILNKINLTKYIYNYSYSKDPKFYKSIVNNYGDLKEFLTNPVKNISDDLLNHDFVVVHPYNISKSILQMLIDNNMYPEHLEYLVNLINKQKTNFYFWITGEKSSENFQKALYNKIDKESKNNVFFGEIFPFKIEHFIDLNNGKVHDDLLNPKIYYVDHEIRKSRILS